MATFTSLTQIKIKFIWTEDCERGFQNMKCSLTHVPVLTLPKLKEPFEVISNASLIGTRAVIVQRGRLVAFESRKFSHAERNYTTGE